MALTDKQKTVINYAAKHDNRITKKEAMELIDDYFCNGAKHVGDVLSRMVKAGLLSRLSPGKFIIGNGKRKTVTTDIENQSKLF